MLGFKLVHVVNWVPGVYKTDGIIEYAWRPDCDISVIMGFVNNFTMPRVSYHLWVEALVTVYISCGCSELSFAFLDLNLKFPAAVKVFVGWNTTNWYQINTDT